MLLSIHQSITGRTSMSPFASMFFQVPGRNLSFHRLLISQQYHPATHTHHIHHSPWHTQEQRKFVILFGWLDCVALGDISASIRMQIIIFTKIVCNVTGHCFVSCSKTWELLAPVVTFLSIILCWRLALVEVHPVPDVYRMHLWDPSHMDR